MASLIAAAACGQAAAPVGEGPTGAPERLTLETDAGPPGAKCAELGATKTTRKVTVNRTFFDPFDTLDLKDKRWTPHYDGGYDWPVKRTLAGNREQQIYLDPGFKGRGTVPAGINPFVVDKGVLTITGDRMPADKKQAMYGFDYYSGLLTTRRSLTQLHGYFEIRATLPKGKALWPAMWLLPEGRTNWPPEIDIVEIDGADPTFVRMVVHYKKDGTGANQYALCRIRLPIDGDRFHTFGALWEPDRITYYVDRRPVAQVATPPGLTTPMYMLINMAIGGNMVGRVDATTPLPARWPIDHAAIYAIDGGKARR